MNFKTYIRDKQVVFTNLALLLITIYTSLQVVLRVDTTQSIAIVRNNTTLGLAGFEKSASSDLYQLALVAVLVLVAHTLLAMRLRSASRGYALLSLFMGITAQVFLTVITSSILSLHR